MSSDSDSDSDSGEDDESRGGVKGEIWQCLKCPAKNTDKLRKCRMCGTERPKDAVGERVALVKQNIETTQLSLSKRKTIVDKPASPAQSPSGLCVHQQAPAVCFLCTHGPSSSTSHKIKRSSASPKRASKSGDSKRASRSGDFKHRELDAQPPPPPISPRSSDPVPTPLPRISEPPPPPDDSSTSHSDQATGTSIPPPPPSDLPAEDDGSSEGDDDDSEAEYDPDAPPPPGESRFQVPKSEIEAAEERIKVRSRNHSRSSSNGMSPTDAPVSPARFAKGGLAEVREGRVTPPRKMSDFMSKLKNLQAKADDS
eukprot:g31745.t1